MAAKYRYARRGLGCATCSHRGLGCASCRVTGMAGLAQNQQNAQIGGEVGGAVGSIFGPVGGAVGSLAGSMIGSMFGPSPHYSSCGMLYDVTSNTQGSDVQELAAMGEPLAAKAVSGAFGVMGDGQGRWAGTYYAALLNRPDLKGVAVGPDVAVTWQKNGNFCNGIQLQKLQISHYSNSGEWLSFPGYPLAGLPFIPPSAQTLQALGVPAPTVVAQAAQSTPPAPSWAPAPTGVMAAQPPALLAGASSSNILLWAGVGALALLATR